MGTRQVCYALLSVTFLLLAGACGSNGDDEKSAATTTSSSTTSSSTTSSSTTSSSTTAPNYGTVSTTTTAPSAGSGLDQGDIPEKSSLNVSFGQTTVNGVAYSNALMMTPSESASELQINAGRSRKRFLGELGVPDDQPSGTVYKVEISMDTAAPVYSVDVRFGETKQIDLDVTNVLRIKIRLTSLSGMKDYRYSQIAIGSPRLA